MCQLLQMSLNPTTDLDLKVEIQTQLLTLMVEVICKVEADHHMVEDVQTLIGVNVKFVASMATWLGNVITALTFSSLVHFLNHI